MTGEAEPPLARLKNHCPLISTEHRRTLNWFGQRDLRCPLLRPDPAQRPRLEQICGNLTARITEAEKARWLGEAEGLKVSLAGARDKLAQMNQITARRSATITLGMPGFANAACRTATGPASLQPAQDIP